MTSSLRISVSALVVSLGTLCGVSPLWAQSGVGLPLGTAAPSAALEDLDGNSVDLLDYVSGRPALIEFWATSQSARWARPAIRTAWWPRDGFAD